MLNGPSLWVALVPCTDGFGDRNPVGPLMKNLVKVAERYEDHGMPAVLKPAPKEAVLFDRMLVVFADESQRFIRAVLFYNSRADKFVAEF